MMEQLYERMEQILRRFPALQDPRAVVRESVPMEELDARVSALPLLCIVQMSDYRSSPGEGLVLTTLRYHRSEVLRAPDDLPPAEVTGKHHGNHRFRVEVSEGSYALFRSPYRFETADYGPEEKVAHGVISGGRIPIPDGTVLVIHGEGRGQYQWETFARRVSVWVLHRVRVSFRLEFLAHEKRILFGDQGVLEQLSRAFAPQEWPVGGVGVQVTPRGGRWVRGEWEENLGLYRAAFEVDAEFPIDLQREVPLMTQLSWTQEES